MTLRHWALLGGLVLATAMGGCQFRAPRTRLSVDELVGRHNANAQLAPNLWARARIQLSLRGRAPLPPVNGLLLLSKTGDPLRQQNFVLIGYETLAVELFRVGSSADEGVYYLWHRIGEGQAWWGRHELAGAPGTRMKDMPIDPEQLLGVLGVCELPDHFTDLPTVALSMTHRPGELVPAGQRCSYVLTYIARQPVSQRILFKKEIYFNWDDSAMCRPFMVNLFDDTGVRTMTARLGDYRAIERPDSPGKQAVMPTDIELSWPEKGSRLHITLSEMSTNKVDWDAATCRFRDSQSGQLPSGIPPENVTQLDAAIGAKGAAK